MKYFFAIASFLFFINSSFAQVNLKSNQVTLPDLIYLYYKDFTNENIVVDDSVDALTKLYKFDVSGMTEPEFRNLLSLVLKENKVQIKDLGGTLYFVVDQNFVDSLPDENLALEQPDAIGGFIAGVEVVQQNLILDYDSIATYTPKYLDIDYVTSVVNSMTGMTYSHNGYMVPIFGSDELVKKVMDFLSVMDVPTPQVHVKALLLEFNDTKVDRSGITLALNALSNKFSLSFGPSSGFANAFSFKNSNIDVIASMIQDDNRFKVLSSPSVLVTSGKSARFHVGSSVPVLDSEYINDRDSVRKSVTYKDSGVLLYVEPVVKQNRVDISITQEISDFQMTKTSNIDSPTLSQRTLQSVLQLSDGETIAIAGLDQWKESTSRSGLWFLPSFFDSVEKRDDFSQIVLLLTVEVIRP